ncbi:pitrilysin family protein [Pedobacter sp. MC2016-24]|uniref:M16 family metallopeptidase n=1 Tax=Pedobacter sp. MC2016-24 TaxID=2780090 RepID=UPI00187DDFA4|nr:M16 family metallopeptidase [Pedobacter sp. MC2016-24]MBE9601576.1 insulinase family protein [Pedobacter sp. MC2016-24]
MKNNFLINKINRILNNHIVLTGLMVFGLLGTMQAQDRKENFKLNEPLILNPAVKTGMLANGFTYFIQKNAVPEKKAVLFLANKVGSILEEDSQRGLAHFLEHMSFNGTIHYPKNELINYLEKAGVRFGADLNAYTNYDETVYQLPIPTNDPELLKNAIQIMRDWAKGLTLDSIEIEKERGVIMEEKRLQKTGQQRVGEKTFPMLVNHSRYADRSPIGTDDVIQHFKHQEIKDFYNDWYRPDLQSIIIVGDIDVDATEKLIKEKFSDLKMPVVVRKRIDYYIPLKGENHFIAVADKELLSTVFQIAYKRPASVATTVVEYRKSMISFFANQMMAERLSDASQANPPYSSISAGINSLVKGVEALSIQIVANPGSLKDNFTAAWGEIQRIKKTGFSAVNLQKAKKLLISINEKIEKERNKASSLELANNYLQFYLESSPTMGVDAETKLIKELIDGISLDEVNSFISTYISDRDRDIIIMSTVKDIPNLPTEEDLNDWMSSSEDDKLSKIEDLDLNAPLMLKKPKPGSILSEKKNGKIGFTELILNNGAKVVLKKTDFMNDEVNIFAQSKGGTSLYSDEEVQSAKNAVGIATSGGVGRFTNIQLKKILSAKSVSASPFIGDRSEGINASSSLNDLETTFQLINLYLTQPKPDSLFFNRSLINYRDMVDGRYNSPENIFQDTITRVLTQNNIRKSPPSLANVEKINFNRGLEIYKERFANVGDFVFTIVGNFDEKKIRSLLQTYIASIPSAPQREQAKNIIVEIPKGMISKTVYAGSEDKASISLVFSGDYSYTEPNNIAMDALSSILNRKLTEELREKESGVYTPSAAVTYEKFPAQKYAIVISFGCSPQNVDKLITSAINVVKQLKTKEVDVEDIQKFTAEQRVTMQGALKSNGFWINYLSRNRLDDLNDEMILGYMDELSKLTPRSLNLIASKYFADDNLIRFVLLPEK